MNKRITDWMRKSTLLTIMLASGNASLGKSTFVYSGPEDTREWVDCKVQFAKNVHGTKPQKMNSGYGMPFGVEPGQPAER
jgi:hypothetical protein